MKRSKKYTAAVAKVDKNKKYALEDAMALMPSISTTKFPGSVNVQLFLNLNDKQKKDSIRGSYTMPNAFGKTIKVLVIADKSDAEKAKDADIFGGEELFKDIEAGTLVFDVLITTPMMMPKIARLGKTLGSKGLMPSPKNGTISTDLSGTIAKFKQGMKNFKSVEAAPISAVVGKTDMEAAKLVENFNAFMKAVLSELKKYGANPVKAIMLSPTMGPKLNIDVNKVTA
jgi:large subunit ribosomal protein L1